MTTTATPTGGRVIVDTYADDAVAGLSELEELLFILVEQAANGGDRRAIARTAALAVAAQRGKAPAAALAAVIAAYATAGAAVELLLGVTLARRAARPAGCGGCAKLIDEALVTMNDRARSTIAAVHRDDDLEDQQLDAVTGHVTADGRRLRVASYARTVVGTDVRRATSAGTADTLTAFGESKVVVSRHHSRHPFCKRLEGKTIRATAGLPPYHVGCTHTVRPAGFTEAEHADALEEAA